MAYHKPDGENCKSLCRTIYHNFSVSGGRWGLLRGAAPEAWLIDALREGEGVNTGVDIWGNEVIVLLPRRFAGLQDRWQVGVFPRASDVGE